jgi:hypothetical protein
MKAIRDPEALRKRISEEEAVLAGGGSLHTELTEIIIDAADGSDIARHLNIRDSGSRPE